MPRKREQERGCQYSRKSVELKADLQKRLRAHTWCSMSWDGWGGEPSAVWSSCVAHTARKEDTDSMVSQRMPIRKVRKSEQIHVKT